MLLRAALKLPTGGSPLRAAAFRTLHTTRATLSKSVHVLEAKAVTGWQEVPVGGIHRGPNVIKNIWYNHAVVPLFATLALASFVCGGFLIKYFGGHTDIAFSKSLRGTFDHQGLSESRLASHNSHFGCRTLNKSDFTIFPFTWVSMDSIKKAHSIDYTKLE